MNKIHDTISVLLRTCHTQKKIKAQHVNGLINQQAQHLLRLSPSLPTRAHFLATTDESNSPGPNLARETFSGGRHLARTLIDDSAGGSSALGEVGMEYETNLLLFEKRPIVKSKFPAVQWYKEWYLSRSKRCFFLLLVVLFGFLGWFLIVCG